MVKLMMIGENHDSKTLGNIGWAIAGKIRQHNAKSYVVLAEGPFLTGYEKQILAFNARPRKPTEALFASNFDSYGCQNHQCLMELQKHYSAERNLDLAIDVSLVEGIESFAVRQTNFYGHALSGRFVLDDLKKYADEDMRSKELLSRALELFEGSCGSEGRLMRIMHEIVSIELELYEGMAKNAVFPQYASYRKKMEELVLMACSIRSEIQAETIASRLHNGYDMIITITGLGHIGEFISGLKSMANSAYSSASKEIFFTDYFQSGVSEIMLADSGIKKNRIHLGLSACFFIIH